MAQVIWAIIRPSFALLRPMLARDTNGDTILLLSNIRPLINIKERLVALLCRLCTIEHRKWR